MAEDTVTASGKFWVSWKYLVTYAASLKLLISKSKKPKFSNGFKFQFYRSVLWHVKRITWNNFERPVLKCITCLYFIIDIWFIIIIIQLARLTISDLIDSCLCLRKHAEKNKFQCSMIEGATGRLVGCRGGGGGAKWFSVFDSSASLVGVSRCEIESSFKEKRTSKKSINFFFEIRKE